MNELVHIIERLQATNAQLAQAERELADNPTMTLLPLEMHSLDKVKRQLEEEFLQVRAELGLEVCRYRILPENGNPKLIGITRALGDFQNVVSIFYDAVKRETPKRSARIGADIAEITAMNFGYAFTGSIGFVLTIPRDRDFYGSYLEESATTIFEVARSKSSEEIVTYARKLGVAPIRVLFAWANEHVKNSMSADIEWHFGRDTVKKALIQKAEFIRLRDAIQQTSDEVTTEFEVTGQLVGADVGTKSFHLKTDDGQEIKGNSGSIISPSNKVEVPNRYRARVRKTTIIQYSIEDERDTYDLISIDPE